MPLYIQEGVNLFVGDDGPDNNKKLNLLSIKLPTMEEIGQTHHAGGAIGEVEVGGLGLKALQATFKVAGYDPQIMSQFGLGRKGRLPYTCYGLIRDKKNNSAVEVKAVMHGRLGRVEGDDFKRGDLLGHDHMLHEIWRYEVTFNKKEVYFYDFLTSDWRVEGVDQYREESAILRL